jgi:hypothetical protein
MAGIEEIIINDHYLIMIATAFFFTALTFVSFWRVGWKPSITKTISQVATFLSFMIAGAAHVAASPSTSPLFPLAYLWFGLGVMFLILLVVDSIKAWDTIQNNKWEGI